MSNIILRAASGISCATSHVPRVGKVVEHALSLYYTAQDPNTPAWAKTVIYGVLGYFILPVDLIPDLIPVVGFSDDLAALVAALATVGIHVTPEIKNRAKKKAAEWFGD